MINAPHDLKSAKSIKEARLFLLNILRLEKNDIKTIILFGIAVSALSLTVPIAAQNIVNAVMLGNILQPIVLLSIFVTLLLSLSAALKFIQRVSIEILQNRIFSRMAMDLAGKLPRTSTKALEAYSGAELTNRFFEVMTVQKSGSLLLLDGVSFVLKLSLGLVLIAFYHPFFLVFDLLLIGTLLSLLWATSHSASQSSIQESKAKYAVISWLEELIKNPILSKNPAAKSYALKRADFLTIEYLKKRKYHFRTFSFQMIGILGIHTISSALLLGGGGWLVMKGQLSLGQLVAAELVLTTSLAAILTAPKLLESYYDILAATEKLNQLLNLDEEKEDRPSADVLEPQAGMSIEFKGVTFGYLANSQPMNFVIPNGESYAICGPNGSGKSTLVSLLYRLREPHTGEVRYNERGSHSIQLDSLRKEIALIRGIEIYPGSIEENLRLGKDSVSTHEVWEALELVNLKSEIEQLPNGLKTELAVTFPALSTGQLSRLMIARALLLKPSLLICDETLDSIDVNTKRKVLESLFSAKRNFTLVITTHDPEIIKRCEGVIHIQSDRSIQIEKK
jgi:putative ABC transport system ATP-binding protein